VNVGGAIQAANPFCYVGSGGMDFSEVGVYFVQGHVKMSGLCWERTS